MVAEEGGPRNRTGGLSVSLSSADGHVIGGGVGGMLIASGPVQACLTSLNYLGKSLIFYNMELLTSFTIILLINIFVLVVTCLSRHFIMILVTACAKLPVEGI